MADPAPITCPDCGATDGVALTTHPGSDPPDHIDCHNCLTGTNTD